MITGRRRITRMSPPLDDAIGVLRGHGREVEGYLRQALESYTLAPPLLIRAIKYSLLDGGKRLRPALVLESWRACTRGRNGRKEALAAAAAIELIHAFSLVHDDLPAMDDDDLRRGRPTCHKVYGQAMAILAGDAMVTIAFQILTGRCRPRQAALLSTELAAAAGPDGMIGGQSRDILGENHKLSLRDLRNLHRMKTAALLRAACRMGAIAAGAQRRQLANLTEFAQDMGLAFQIADDLLDLTATAEQLGKATGKDATKGKNTYPALLGTGASRREAQKLLQRALAKLENMGQAADGLRTLARFVVQRQV